MMRFRITTCRRSQPITRTRSTVAAMLGLLLGSLLTNSGCSSFGPGSLVGSTSRSILLRAQTPERGSSTHTQAMNERAQSLVQKAASQYRAGQLKAAQKSLRAALKADPSVTTPILQMQAQIAFDLGDLTGYRAALRAIAIANPHTAPFQNAVGELLVWSGQVDEGLKFLKKAVSLAPRNVAFAQDLAAVYLGNEQPTEAEKVLTQAIQGTPHHKSLPIALARVYELTGSWESAAFYFEMALKDEPQNHVWRRQQARSLYRLGKFELARQRFATCAAADSSLLSMAEYVEFGDACLRTGELDQAQTIFDTIVQREPNRLKDIELLRGLCALKRGKREAARQIVNNALTIWPEDAVLHDVLTLCNAVETEKPTESSEVGLED